MVCFRRMHVEDKKYKFNVLMEKLKLKGKLIRKEINNKLLFILLYLLIVLTNQSERG